MLAETLGVAPEAGLPSSSLAGCSRVLRHQHQPAPAPPARVKLRVRVLACVRTCVCYMVRACMRACNACVCVCVCVCAYLSRPRLRRPARGCADPHFVVKLFVRLCLRQRLCIFIDVSASISYKS